MEIKTKGEKQVICSNVVSSRSYVAVSGSFRRWWNTNPVIDGQGCGVDTANHADDGQADISTTLESGSRAGFEMEQRLIRC